MSLNPQPLKQKASSFSFAPTISFENLIWTIVQQIALSPGALPDSSDPKRVHGIFLEYVQNFDDIVHSILTTNENLPQYETERKVIVEAWANETDLEKQLDLAHRLFRLSLETLSSKRLFKVKQYSYFRLGFLKAEGAAIEEIQSQETRFADDS